MITLEGIDDIVVNGGVVITSDGLKLGSVEQVFLSEDSGAPAFVTVRTGLFGMLESFVPLAGASIDGSRVVVAFDRDRIRNGPRIESDRGSISTDEESELYGYYGLDGSEVPADTGTDFAAGDTSPDAPACPPPPPPHDGPHPVPPHLRRHRVDDRPPPPPHPPHDPHDPHDPPSTGP